MFFNHNVTFILVLSSANEKQIDGCKKHKGLC